MAVPTYVEDVEGFTAVVKEDRSKRRVRIVAAVGAVMLATVALAAAASDSSVSRSSLLQAHITTQLQEVSPVCVCSCRSA